MADLAALKRRHERNEERLRRQAKVAGDAWGEVFAGLPEETKSAILRRMLLGRLAKRLSAISTRNINLKKWFENPRWRAQFDEVDKRPLRPPRPLSVIRAERRRTSGDPPV
jgi:hypothetical protein